LNSEEKCVHFMWCNIASNHTRRKHNWILNITREIWFCTFTSAFLCNEALMHSWNPRNSSIAEWLILIGIATRFMLNKSSTAKHRQTSEIFPDAFAWLINYKSLLRNGLCVVIEESVHVFIMNAMKLTKSFFIKCTWRIYGFQPRLALDINGF
jgi:hypothetical protein